MLALAASTLRDRWPALAGAFAALALGAALVISAGGVVAAGSGEAGTGPVRFAAAPAVVAPQADLRYPVGAGEDREIESDPNPHPAPLDAGLPERLAAVPGVTRVAADRTFAVRVPGGAGRTDAGRPWGIRLATPYVLRAGRAPRADDEVALTAGAPGARPGTTVSLVTPAGPARYRVAGVVAPRGAAPPERPVFFPDAVAARLAPGVDAVAVWPRAAAPAIRALGLPGATVLTGDGRARAEDQADRTALAGAAILLGLMGMTVGFVAVFTVASSFAFAVALRRRELGLLRAIGATPRQIRRLVLGEAALLGLAAACAGAVLSLVTAPLLGRWVASHGLAPDGLAVPPSPVAMAVGAGFMVVVGLCGAWLAARRAARVRPADALRDAAVDRRVMTIGRWLIGLPALACGLLLTGGSGEADGRLLVALAQCMCFVVALAMLAPLVIPPLVALVVGPARMLPRAEPLLVRRHARAAVRRTAATAAPVLVMVALVGALATMVDSLEASDRASVAARTDPAAAVVTGDGPLSEHDVAALRGVPGATVGATLEGDLRAFGGDGLTPFATVGVEPSAIPLVLRARVVAGTLEQLRGDGVALGELTARGLRKRVGDGLDVWLPDGTPQRVTVVAVVADGFGVTGIYAARELLAGHAGPGAATSAHVRGGDRAARDRVAAGLGLRIEPGVRERAVADPTDSSNMNRLALWVVAGIAVLYVGISLAGTSAVGTLARGGELALLRLAGATPRQVLGLVALEAVVTTLVGAALGLVATAGVVLSLRGGLADLEGPAVVAVPWALLSALVLVAAAVAAGAAVLAAHRSQARAPHLPAAAAR